MKLERLSFAEHIVTEGPVFLIGGNRDNIGKNRESCPILVRSQGNKVIRGGRLIHISIELIVTKSTSERSLCSSGLEAKHRL
jgi:hypothetical protein